MRRSVVRAITVAAALAAAPAAAHVAPSTDNNNRYVKLTPLGDRVRLAYTVFYGEIPGARMRRTIDADRTGTIDDPERQAFGTTLAAEIAAALEVTVDGVRQPIAWSQIVVGMGTPQVAAGSFSVDLVAWLCLAAPRGTHAVLLRDRYRLASPGETEVKVEDSPGVKVDHARIGVDDDLGYDYKIIGPGGPLEDDGLDLQFTADDKAPVTSDAICQGQRSRRALPTGAIVVAAAVTAFVLAGLVTLGTRRRRRVGYAGSARARTRR
ncbi:MAG TPA: hypothetical protein VHN14_18110 [Kofleriaceae bacterium]|nr:hypothetical protein [Kofleriaceae bacterium]